MKRKLDQENRTFQSKWEVEYLFIEFKGKPMCLVCLETLSAMKDFNLSRHYNTLHKVKYEKYTGAARGAVVANLNLKYINNSDFLQELQLHRNLHSKRLMLFRLSLPKPRSHCQMAKLLSRVPWKWPKLLVTITW